MEKVICPKCKMETLASLSFCRNCKEKLPTGLNPVVSSSPQETAINKRHGFTTFWLWFLIIINALVLITNFAPEWAWGKNYAAVIPAWSYFMNGVAGLIQLWGLFSLLRWRKAGFNTVIIAIAISLIVSLMAGAAFNVMTVVSPIVGLLVLYGVLQLKSNGVSCWEQLE